MTPFSAQVHSLLNGGSAANLNGVQQTGAGESEAPAGAVTASLIGLGEWLLELLTSTHQVRSNVWLRRALVECPVSDIRRDFALLLSRTIRSLLRPTAARRTAPTAAPTMQVSPDETAVALSTPLPKAIEDAQNRIEVLVLFLLSFYYL